MEETTIDRGPYNLQKFKSKINRFLHRSTTGGDGHLKIYVVMS